MNRTEAHVRLTASLEELAQSGSPVDLSVAVAEVEDQRVEIVEVGDMLSSQVFELQNGRVAYMADIAVTNQTARTIDVIDVELRTSWDDSSFQWLTPQEVKSEGRARRGDRGVYWFPGDVLEFGYGEVINHRLMERGKLPGKRRLEGLLLAIGGLMPAELVHGQLLHLPLRIIAADHAEYSTTLQLLTQRLPTRTKTVKPRRRLFVERDGEQAMRPEDVTDIALPPAGQTVSCSSSKDDQQRRFLSNEAERSFVINKILGENEAV